jgi:hypothetical protein
MGGCSEIVSGINVASPRGLQGSKTTLRTPTRGKFVAQDGFPGTGPTRAAG